jgi:large subunit ribosomal protein L3
MSEEITTANPATEVASGSTTLSQGLGGVLGVKAGMTQYFDKTGACLAVTVIDLRTNKITQIKTEEKEGYLAVQVGMLEKKLKSAKKSEIGHLKKSGGTPYYHYHEFRFPVKTKLEGLAPGLTISAEFLKEGDYVDLTSVSKGKGFAGVIKRHHFGGAPASHGHSISHRMPGSIGNRADPGKVFKNKRMAGHMGNEQVTIQNVRVVKVDLENQLLLVHGSVPGPRTGIVTVRKAVKLYP